MNFRHAAALGAVVAITTTAAVVVPAVASDATSSGKISVLIVQQTVKGKDSGAAVVSGAINAGGKDVSPDNGDYDVIHLPGGTFRVVHPDKDSKFSFKPHAKTCVYSFSGAGSYTLAKGTGRYQGIKGSGKYKIHGEGIAPRKKGTCNFENGVPLAGAAYVTGSGTVTLP